MNEENLTAAPRDEWVPADVDTVRAFDAMFCPQTVPAGYAAALGYAGGSSAARAWTDEEWARVSHLARMPIWVPTPGLDNPLQAAIEFAAVLERLGVPPAWRNGGRHVRVLWDLETGREPDPRWLDRAADRLRSAGYFSVSYGSPSWAFGQPRRAGYLPANPTGEPHLYLHPDVVGTQYEWDKAVPGGVVNSSLLTVDLVRSLWLPTPAS